MSFEQAIENKDCVGGVEAHRNVQENCQYLKIPASLSERRGYVCVFFCLHSWMNVKNVVVA